MCTAFHQGLRHIRRNRRMSASVIGIMALCIGSCVAIGSVVHAVILTGWGYVNEERLAIVWHARPNGDAVVGVGPRDFMTYRSSMQTVDNMAAVTTRGVNLGGTPATRVTCARMTDAMFPLLGVSPSRGRWFSADEDRQHARVVVISERLLPTSMAGLRDAIDRDVLLDGVAHRVIGVMPASFTFPPEGVQSLTPADCWLPASFTPAELAIPSFSYVQFARMKPGVALERVGADAHRVAQQIWSTYPAAVQSQTQLTARVVPLSEQVLARSRMPLALFVGAVAALLVVGIANVANVILTGLDSRRGELAVRASLGATPRTLVKQLLFESIALTVTGGVLGIVLAGWLLSAMIAVNATALPRLAEARIDGWSIATAIGCGIGAGAAGALPTLMRLRRRDDDHVHGLRSATRGLTYGLRGVLIAVELALAVAVLVIGGLLARTVIGLNAIDAGFDPRGLLTFSVALPESSYKTAESIRLFAGEMQLGLARLAGVSVTAVSSAAPMGEAAAGVVFTSGSATPEYKPTLVQVVSPDYARTLSLAVRDGRFIDPTDSGAGPIAVVINETLSRALFPDKRAVGRTVHRIGSTRPHTVVGVIADVRQAGPQRQAPPAIYVPLAQAEQPVRALTFVLRSRASTRALMPELRRVVADVDGTLPPFAVRSGDDLLNASIAPQRFNLLIVTAFAVFAVALALSGVYAVLRHAVEQTERESGIRMALGATGRQIVAAIGTRALIPAIAGIAAGVAGAAAASKLIASVLFGITPNDPVTLVAAAASILLAATAVVLFPAAKAARVDLVTLLRHE